MWGQAAFSILLAGALAVSLAGCPGEHRESIFDQGAYGKTAMESALALDGTVFQQQADRFILAAGLTTIAGLEWWGVESNPQVVNNFIVRIYETDASGKPLDAPLYAIPVGDPDRTKVGTLASGSKPNVYKYAVDFTPFSLVPGDAYYLSIVNDNGCAWSWVVTAAGPFSPTYAREDDTREWSASLIEDKDYNLAFRLLK